MSHLRSIIAFSLALAIGATSTVQAQTPPKSPAQDGLRFVHGGEKKPETLAPKAGGPTERIEIQSTDDHIDYVIKTYELKRANAAEVFELIQLAVESEGGKVSRIAPGSACEVDSATLDCSTHYEGSSLLVVTVPEWMIPHLDQTISLLDRENLEASTFGTASIFLDVKHRHPSEVAEMIRETVASPYIVLKPDDSRQILYLEDTPSYFAADLEAFRRYDAPPPQLETRVRIYEIEETQGREVGLDWDAWKRSLGGTINGVWQGNPGSYNLNLQSLSAELSLSPAFATDFLNYLVGTGKAEVITDTRVTQINGRTATVESVSAVPFVVKTATEGARQDSPSPLDADGLIKEFQEGVIVEMTPRIAHDVELEIRSTVASHLGYTPGQNVPIIASSDLNTVALLQPDRPAVLGGLTRKSIVRERSGVAGLKDIPGLTYLFSREVERKRSSVVIITIELNRVLNPTTLPAPLKPERNLHSPSPTGIPPFAQVQEIPETPAS